MALCLRCAARPEEFLYFEKLRSPSRLPISRNEASDLWYIRHMKNYGLVYCLAGALLCGLALPALAAADGRTGGNSAPAWIQSDAVLLGCLLAILGFVFWSSTSPIRIFRVFYKFVPMLLMCYFLPSLLTLSNLADPHASQLYFVASRYLLPASLILLTLSVDLKEILKLGPKRVIFNPGTENPELYKLLKYNGIAVEIACTLVLLATNQYQNKPSLKLISDKAQNTKHTSNLLQHIKHICEEFYMYRVQREILRKMIPNSPHVVQWFRNRNDLSGCGGSRR